jgi:hypothetical protein
VEWTTLLGTLLGAAIAMSTSLAVQARKDRHDVAAEWRRTRREMYMAFITALAKARSELLALSKQSGATGTELDETARQVFAPCYEPRQHLELVAPSAVTEPALAYFRTVRGLRDLVADGKSVGDAEWGPNAKQVKSTLDTTRDAMRTDLQRV